MMHKPLFEVRECTNPDCRLRIPIEQGVYEGSFCPRCGAPLRGVVLAYRNQVCSDPNTTSTRNLSVLLDNIRSAYNVGSIFRTADGLDIRHVYLCGITPSPDKNSDIQKTSLGAAAYVPWSKHTNALILASQLREECCFLIALECCPQAKPIHQYQPDPDDPQPIVLMIGNERAGLDPELIELSDVVLMLPMMGEKASLNVAVAFGVAAYWLQFQNTSG
jgi:23S rRNA (guanosine2251-2'-O)-methyltransferase